MNRVASVFFPQRALPRSFVTAILRQPFILAPRAPTTFTPWNSWKGRRLRVAFAGGDRLIVRRRSTLRCKSLARSLPQGIRQFGLIAEDVEKLNPDLVVHDSDGKPYSVRYEAVKAMLLNEFLKEHQKVKKQEAAIARLNPWSNSKERISRRLWQDNRTRFGILLRAFRKSATSSPQRICQAARQTEVSKRRPLGGKSGRAAQTREWTATVTIRPRRQIAKSPCYAELGSQHLFEFNFIDDGNAELFCLVEFAAWFIACQNVIGFLADAAGDVAPQRLDLLSCFFARHRGQSAGEHKSLSSQRQLSRFFW